VFGLVSLLRVRARHCAGAMIAAILAKLAGAVLSAVKIATAVNGSAAVSTSTWRIENESLACAPKFASATIHNRLRALTARIAELFNGGLPQSLVVGD
jgi:hypothetical protein